MYAYALRTPHSAHGLTVTPDTGSRAEGRHTIARGGEATHTHTAHNGVATQDMRGTTHPILRASTAAHVEQQLYASSSRNDIRYSL